MAYIAKSKDEFIVYADDLIHVMDNIELMAYKKQLDKYRPFIIQHAKDYLVEYQHVVRALKERIEDLEFESLVTQIEREECDLWQLEHLTKIH
jgi:hypothetical protein